MSPRRSTKAAPSTQCGAFLLEALIAILIFSFGILGIVGLQANAVSFTNDAQYRGEAAHHANSLIARMWTDNVDALEATYEGKDGAGGPGYEALLAALEPEECSDAKKAARSCVLPGVAENPPTVEVTPGNPANGEPATMRNVIITIRWQAPGEPVHQYVQTATIGLNN
jgi:type IV pilus assembly protein PilV